ncbi:hypothetical protein GCM10022251_30340 [Phytohabitans flavus]|uniref:Uncharacterized protein n=1 Tax=Phytohabitans flavus TaxID=1076124 RepID=A0A6F8XWZ3_9ACTN|nr:hypothetical protein Pflav_047920 [Phytohabitans flavus]
MFRQWETRFGATDLRCRSRARGRPVLPPVRAAIRCGLSGCGAKDDRQVRGAFFELYLHERLLRIGYTVTCHPVLEGTSRRPDFLAERDGRSIYIEARSASATDVAVGAAAPELGGCVGRFVGGCWWCRGPRSVAGQVRTHICRWLWR